MLMVVEAWVGNGYGSVTELAEAIGKSKSQIRSYATELRKEGRLPPARNANKQQRRLASASVENTEEEEVIDVEVMQAERLPGETFTEMKKRLRNNNNTPAPENNVRQHQPERDDQRSDAGSDGDDPYWNVDAAHWQSVQDSNEPDSYKQAQELLTRFSLLLRKGSRDGWSQSAFNSLRDDLDSWSRTCAACSDNYRERTNERAEEEWRSIERSLCGGEGGISPLSITGGELD